MDIDVPYVSFNEHEWTTGNDSKLSHQRAIASGSYGDVHEVLPFLIIAKYV